MNTLIVSLVSLVISIFVGVVSIIVMIRPQLYSISILATVEKFHSEISIIITNKGVRPLNITSFSIGYGPNQFEQQIILKEELKKPIKIKDGEIYEHSISRIKVIDAVKSKTINQLYSQRLWVGVNLSNLKTFYKLISIDPSIIKNKYLPLAVDFIAADIFIGFSQQESSMEFKGIIGIDKNDVRGIK